ncbi:MAG: tetratricopeptide repeat protein, partial [Acetobacteraceae bacterium]
DPSPYPLPQGEGGLSRGSRWAPRAAAIGLLLGAAACSRMAPPDPAREALRDSPALDLRLADATLSAGAPDTALHVVNGMLARDPDDVPALLRRGRALMALNQPADAARSFARVAALRPDSREALTGLARARLAEGDAKNAESAWRQALALAPGEARLRTGLAISLDLQERHAEAQALYRSVLAQTPDDPAIRSDLGLSLALSGHPAEGVGLLREAARGGFGADSAASSRARHNLAAGFVLAGDEAAARAELSQDLPPAEVTAALAGLRQFAAAR